MAALLGESDLQVLFSRAFLLELERGNLANATLFARAFLKRHAPDPSDPDLIGVG